MNVINQLLIFIIIITCLDILLLSYSEEILVLPSLNDSSVNITAVDQSHSPSSFNSTTVVDEPPPNSISKPLTSNRTAICISGQMRSGNLTWTSGKLRNNAAFRMFGNEDPPTPIQTILEFLMKPIAIYGGLDVFMFVTAHPETNMSNWNGDPYDFEPEINNTNVCEPYLKSPIFHPYTGNKFFCIVEPEETLMTNFILNNSLWDTYTYGKVLKLREQVLQQYYGMYRANIAAKQYALMKNIKYTYKIRLRPDLAITQVFDKIDQLYYGPDPANQCVATVYCPNHYIYGNGAEDSFNMGLAEDMDKILDRYVDFTQYPFVYRASNKGHWDLEDHLLGVLEKYKLCFKSESALWLVVIRKQAWGLNDWEPPPKTIEWQEMRFNSNFNVT